MKLFLLVVCCVIATSCAGPFSAQEEKLEAALNDIEVLLQDIKEKEAPAAETQECLGDFPKPTSPEPMDEVLLYTEDVAKATAEIEAVGGRISIQMGSNVLIANIPTKVAAMQETFAYASTNFPSTASLEVEVFKMYQEKKNNPKPRVQKWTDKSAPIAYPQLKPLEANSPYTLTMRGKIAVAIVVPSGPGPLFISLQEYTLVLSQVVNAFNFWQAQAPRNAQLSFVLFHWGPPITAPNSRPNCFEAGCHDVFAIPALQAIGYQSKDHLAATIKGQAGAVGAYIGFISKYHQHHFAYAYFGGGPLYMEFSNDGWGPGQIDRVFAHETGHVFNAPDEYSNCQCNVPYGKGVCRMGNANCRGNDGTACTRNQYPCIMDKNDLSNVCLYTRKHIGWC